MKRKAQIEQKALELYPYVGETKGVICENSRKHFIRGAEWVDENIDEDGVIEYFKTKYRDKLVDKAYEWIDANILNYDFGEIGSKNRLLEDFSNAMTDRL